MCSDFLIFNVANPRISLLNVHVVQTKSLGHGLNFHFVVEFGARNVKLWLIRLELEVVEGGG